MPTFPLGHHAYKTRLANARRIAKLEPDQEPTHQHRGFEFPIPLDIRGIPAVGRSIAGHIRGTQPEAKVCR